MRKWLIFIFAILFSLFFLSGIGLCQRGCCSHHGGVCGDKCCDGTPLSAKCRGSSSTYTPPVAPESSGTYSSPTRQTYDKPSTAPLTPDDTVKGEKKGLHIVIFKDGKKIKTETVWEEDNQIKFYLHGAVIGYPKEKIERIESLEGDSPPPATSQPATSAKPKTGKGNTWNDSFNDSKRTLERQVYADHRVTFYCGCPFDAKKTVLSCDNFKSKSGSERASRVEWEHIVPAAHFGQSFKEWRDGHPDCVDGKDKPFKGRNCASKVAIPYRYMESDLYNLVPAIGEVNGLRSNFRFDMIPGESREFGACDMEIDSQARVAEPPERVRGDIARTYKYMNQTYPGHGIIGGSSVKLFDAWDQQDPVDQWECKRCKRIEAIQGNENSVVKEACQKAGLW